MSAKKVNKNDNKIWMLAIIAAIVCIAMFFVIKNDNQNPNKETDPPIVPAKYNASASKVGSWVEESKDRKDYFVTILLSSQDYYCKPQKDCVMYLDENQYKPIHEVFEDIDIDFYYASEGVFEGFYTYVKIHTHQLIDTKRIYFQLSGPRIYDQSTLTKEDYIAIHGNNDGWCEMLCGISTKFPDNDSAVQSERSMYEGTIMLFNETNSIFYIKPTATKASKLDNAYLKEFIIESLTGESVDVFCTNFSQTAECVTLVDDVVASDKLDDRLKIVAKVTEGRVMIGYETVDGSSINNYDGVIPKILRHSYIRDLLFVICDE